MFQNEVFTLPDRLGPQYFLQVKENSVSVFKPCGKAYDIPCAFNMKVIVPDRGLCILLRNKLTLFKYVLSLTHNSDGINIHYTILYLILLLRFAVLKEVSLKSGAIYITNVYRRTLRASTLTEVLTHLNQLTQLTGTSISRSDRSPYTFEPADTAHRYKHK
jgi:hypothetical protein